MTYDFDLFVNKSAWKLNSVDSQHCGNEALLAFDGKNDTFWHTNWGSDEPRQPHTIVIDMAKNYLVTAVTYLARQDGNQNGRVKGYESYLSNDSQSWGAAAVTGEFKNTTALQVAKLPATTEARYIKFTATSEINGNAWTSAAEIGIQAEAPDDVKDVESLMFNVQNSASVYDLSGRQLTSSPVRGTIVIMGGRKILIK